MTTILYTDQQNIDSTYPTRLEVLGEIEKRNGLDEKLADEYNRLSAGAKGEQLVYDYIQEFGERHWTVMRNVWLDYYGEFEIDLLLMTDVAIYAFEIKHFSGVYEFKNNQCSRNGQKIGHNAISQSQKSFINVQNLFHRHGYKQQVHGVVVFTGEHFDLKLHDDVGDLTVLMINQLRDYIWKITRMERQSIHKHTTIDDILYLLNQQAAANPFPPYPVTAEMGHRLTKGILCSHCKAPNIYSQKSYLECRCGMVEPRENAIVRTICEYGIIHFDRELVTGELHQFFGGELSRRTIFLYLNQYFKRSGERRGTQYENMRQSFWTLYDTFGFKKTRYYRC